MLRPDLDRIIEQIIRPYLGNFAREKSTERVCFWDCKKTIGGYVYKIATIVRSCTRDKL